jgi:antitoxin component HigA of HigAB toxin-antitoxin module
MEMTTNTLEAPGMKAVAAASNLSVPRYGNLLKRFAPKVIETPEENRLALQIVERLMSIGDGRRSAEENALLSLLAALVEQFERKAYPATAAEPREILRDLMEHNGLKAADLRMSWADAHALPRFFPANGQSVRSRRSGSGSASNFRRPRSYNPCPSLEPNHRFRGSSTHGGVASISFASSGSISSTLCFISHAICR